MKPFVTFEARDLAKALKPIVAIIERRNAIPILSCVRIKSGKDGCYLSGSDLDIFLDVAVQRMDWKGEIDLALDAGVLFKIARASGVMPVRVEEGSETFTVQTRGNGKEKVTKAKALIAIGDGDASYDLPTQKPENFPSMPGEDGDTMLASFDAGYLPTILGKVKFCISTEETRYYLNGVCWDMCEKGTYFVATDGHKLSACRYSEGLTDAASRRIIPRKAVAFICQHLRDLDLSIYGHEWAHPAMRIVAPGIVMRLKLIDGTFPDWHRAVPVKHDAEWAMRRDEMTQAIKQVCAVASGKTQAVKFDGDDGRMIVTHTSPDFGTAKAVTQAKWHDGAEHFATNRDYFLAMMGSCDKDFEVRREGGLMEPLVFVDSDERMTRVLMPMRV